MAVTVESDLFSSGMPNRATALRLARLKHWPAEPPRPIKQTPHQYFNIRARVSSQSCSGDVELEGAIGKLL